MRNQKTGSKYKQLTDVNAVVQQIESEFDTTIGLFINHKLGLIRLRGHNPKGGYDVHDVRDEAEAKPAELY